jgi:hypothetical protein
LNTRSAFRFNARITQSAHASGPATFRGHDQGLGRGLPLLKLLFGFFSFVM